jgi:hypothetical protein
VSPVRYELGIYIPEDDIPHSHRRETLKSYGQTIVYAHFSYCNMRQASPKGTELSISKCSLINF